MSVYLQHGTEIILKDSMCTRRQNSLFCFFWLLKNLPFWSCHSWGANKRRNISITKNAREIICDNVHLKPLLRSHLELLILPRPLLPISRVPPWKLLPWTGPLWKTNKNKEKEKNFTYCTVNVDWDHQQPPNEISYASLCTTYMVFHLCPLPWAW